MSTIRTAIELQDNFTSILDSIISTVNTSVSTMDNLSRTMNNPVDTASFDAAREAANQATIAIQNMEEAMQNADASTTGTPAASYVTIQPEIDVPDEIDVPVNAVVKNQPHIEVPDGLNVPVTAEVTQQPQIDVPDGLEVPVDAVVTQQPEIDVPDEIDVPVNVIGAEQNEQKIEQLKNSLDGIENMQNAINSVGSSLYILPEDSKREIVDVNKEITRMQQALNFIQENPFMLDTSITTVQIQAMSDSLDDLMQRQKQLDESLGNIPSQVVQIEYENETPELDVPENIRIPIEWQSDNMEVFTGTGIERFQQEVQSANNMLNTLNTTQARIAATAAQTDLFPAGAVADMNNMQNRLTAISQRIQAIENNPLNLGSDEANAELEQLRGQLDQAVQQQEALNKAVENMDVEAANQAYLQLSQTVGNTERYIRDNTNEQGQFNNSIEEGTEQANKLTNMIKGAVAAYVSFQTAQKALDLSDQLTSTTARLNLMNDGLQTTQDLQNMIYLSAERSRGSYQQTADAVSKLGLMAGDAFSSSEEIIAFAEQLNKQFTIAGTEAAGVDAAMLQLTQAMSSGVLRGEEYNSILEQAPNIIDAIADYLDVPKGQLKDMAAEGQITAEIVKNAMFAAADETNAKFESMPMTFSQIWTSFENTALMAFQPVLERLNEIANSESFQTFIENAVESLSMVASVALGIFDLMVQLGSVIADNWSWIAPIIGTATAALVAYYTALGIYNGIQLISNGIKAAAALAESVHSASLAMEAGATFSAAAAQYGFNAALFACPLTWIIACIIALIAVVIAVAHHISDLGGTATTTFGVLAGGVNVVIQFFKNLGLEVANIALGIASAIGALANNVRAAFHNAICSVQSWWYDLLSTCLEVIESVCEALNKLPLVEFDYSGVTDAAEDYAAKSEEALASKESYESISDAFNDGVTTFDTFADGWVTDAYDAGASWGDNISDKVSDKISDVFNGDDVIPDPNDYKNLGNYANLADYDLGNYGSEIDLSGIGSGVDDIAGNTGAIADSMDITEEDLKYLRDIAEQEAVNRFTTAEITIEQTNNNNISSNMDLDGVVSGLTDAVNEAVDSITEGVHD